MNEYYLHYLWTNKSLPFHQMKLVDGRDFKILDFGQYNPVESGPDFSNAKIIIDGITWCGSVEIHLKSSDWYKHKHHKDQAYDNVILHVVLNSDELVVQNGIAIPEISLADFIDLEHHTKFKKHYRFKKNWNCSGMLGFVPSNLVNSHINKFLNQRLKRKTDELLRNYHFLEQRSVFCLLLAKSFGTKPNQLPFEMLARLISKVDFSKYQESEQITLILFSSGLYYPKTTKEKIFYQIFIRQNECLPSTIWKKGGLRPHNQPEKRIKEFAYLYSYLIRLNDKEWDRLVDQNLFGSYFLKYNFSEKFVGHLLINSISPFYFWMAEHNYNLKFKEYYLQTLEQQAPEINRITKLWSNSKNYLRNARDSQAFLEIYGELCSNKLCLNCSIGKYLIKDENNSEDNFLF